MRHSVKNLTLIALFAVIIAICSWVTIPFYVVPFTLQTLGVFLTLRFLGSKRGTVAIAVYLVLGALGVPVFAGFTGGIGRLLGPTGGYLVGFLVSGLVMMLLDRWKAEKYVWTLLKMAIAMAAWDVIISSSGKVSGMRAVMPSTSWARRRSASAVFRQ